MPCCAVVSCKNRSEKKSLGHHGISYHIVLEKYVSNCRKDFIEPGPAPPAVSPTSSHQKCQLHLKTSNEKSEEPPLKRVCVQQKDEECQELQNQDLKSAEPSIIETPRKRRLRMKITQRENLIKKQKIQIKRLKKKNMPRS
ncbi:hypothetical protein HF086_010808 [Spodoptera exigua]|uniref:THAP-type domain-containing protein n=1 Tax=Spodoptera exigua TaxID=7107 RepID=A0A922M9U0_SPOEX|nr:hypothetical protein HF086_010808 [Spodoptera exigua]